jgi:asparagine synthase (glutamine-hydrolysing)
MCGIFFILGRNKFTSERTAEFIEASNKIIERGPDNTTISYDDTSFMCFQRLKVNDLTDAGNQPMFHDEVFLLCNGEIYNHEELKSEYYLECKSHSDCEVVLMLYLKLKEWYSMKEAVMMLPQLLDGEFAFVIYDKKEGWVHVCRDPYGVRPLFWYNSDEEIGVCSELKGIHTLNGILVEQFPSGHICSITEQHGTIMQQYHEHKIVYKKETVEEKALIDIRDNFTNAVKKRLMSDRPVCSLLSGGLDSSLVSAILAREIAPNKLTTFSIGIQGSTDLIYAKKVADHIGSIHHSVELKETDFCNAIEETIRIIESYDITSVRASVGNYLISKYIAENTDFKVVYNGDYSDEVCGGYMYFKKAPDGDEFHKECCRLVSDICFFDSLRSDRTISSQGLEARVPFSDKAFVTHYMSIDPKLRMSNDKIEKYMLRKAFDGTDLLPNEVLFRSKVAFSDGVSSTHRSWHDVIKDYIDMRITDVEFTEEKEKYTFNKPETKEAYYYRKVFDKYYPNSEHVIPYMWLPKWCGDIKDPSARELDFYKEDNKPMPIKHHNIVVYSWMHQLSPHSIKFAS